MAPLRNRVGGVDWRARARRYAQREGLDPHVFERQIGAESNFDPAARSPAGATGIAQIMPATARGWGVDPSDPDASLRAAARNMAQYVKKYGSYENALRAYNAGPGAIEASKGYAETNNYVKKILGGRDPGGLSEPSRGGRGAAGAPGGASGASSSVAGVDAVGADPVVVPEMRPQVPSAAITPPDFSATRNLAMPAGLGTVESAWQPRTSLGQAVSERGFEGQDPNQTDPIAESLVGKERTRGLKPDEGASSALNWAQSKVGFRETGENRGGLADYLNQRFGFSGAPWCAMFTSAAVTKGGAPASARTASVAQVRAKASKGVGYHRGYVNPREARPGDLILFGNAHIGMVQRVAGGRIHYVGGNQSDGVTEASAPARGASIVRPKYGARK